MGVQALIMINPSGAVQTERQMEACLAYVTASPTLDLAAVLRPGADSRAAADSIRSGEADVVVLAYRDPKLELTQEIEAAGGHVEYVQLAEPARLTVRGVIAQLHRRLGWSAAQIARAIGGTTADVTDHLRRASQPPKN